MRCTLVWLLISAGVVTSGCNGGNAEPKSEPTPSPRPIMKDHDKPSGPVQHVKIDNFSYEPRSVTIAPGTKVVWTNRDDVPHTATSTAKPKAFDSRTLDTDQSFEFVFTKPGTYEYYCAVHPKMTATIIVK